ncbi:arylesterase [Methylovulum psychrotolerans]|nr:arylesterase [Methylovulum psychrotolerans]
MAVMAKSIVVLGDSISAAYGMEVDQGWVALLQAKLNKDQPGRHSIHNESISGDTSAGGLARIDAALALHKPDLVLLELGANDGLRGLSPVTMKANLTEIIRRAQQAGAKVLLLGMKIPPNYGKRYIDLFYNVYPQLANELNLPLVPFILEEVALDPALMQADGLHPNAKAQPIIADKIAAYVFPLL